MTTAPEPTFTYAAQVIRVIDADTLDVQVDVGFRVLARLPLRIAHIDAPERFTEAGKKATAYVTELVGAASCVVVRTFKPTDKYGRYLADVYVDGRSVGDLLVEAGLAVPYEGGAR